MGKNHLFKYVLNIEYSWNYIIPIIFFVTEIVEILHEKEEKILNTEFCRVDFNCLVLIC